MNYLVGAMALLLAAPVAAQTAPATDPHAGHVQHQQHGKADHSKHQADCCKDAAKHQECCVEAAQQGKKMDCCAKGADKAGASQGHSGN